MRSVRRLLQQRRAIATAEIALRHARGLCASSKSRIPALGDDSAAGDRLIDVIEEDQKDEITVYIKGFLSKGESPCSFNQWKEGHLKLCGYPDGDKEESMAERIQNYVEDLLGQEKEEERELPIKVAGYRLPWRERMVGYYWQSGELTQIGSTPVPIATLLNAAWHGYRVVSRAARIIPSPQAIAFAAVQEIGLTAGQLIMQYSSASSHVEAHAHVLAGQLAALRDVYGYKHVRVVAHSLGCKMLLQSIYELGDQHLPDEVHLCAPAVRERDVEFTLARAARERLFIYHCDRDLVLNTAFRVMEFGDALGSAGPSSEQLQRCNKQVPTTVVNADSIFGFKVHGDYRYKLDKLVLAAHDLVNPEDVPPEFTQQ